MIILSQSLVLSSDEGINLSNPIIGWRNIVHLGNIVSDTAADGFPVTNLANVSTAEKWRGAGDSPAADEHITITTDETDPIDYVAIAGHNFGSAQIAVGLEYLDDSDSPSSWVELVSQSIPADDGPIIFRFEPQSIASLRVRMEPGNEAPEAAVLYGGKLLVMERSFSVGTGHSPLDFARETDVVDGMSEAGGFLGRIVLAEFTDSAAEFEHITPQFYRSEVDPFVRHAREFPFFFSWAPADYPQDVGFAWMSASPKPHVDGQTDRMSVTFPMRGVV